MVNKRLLLALVSVLVLLATVLVACACETPTPEPEPELGSEERENTGHGGRSGGGPTNVIPTLGSKTADEIIAETDEGIYVNYGGVFPNMVTGEISASVDLGFKIEGGKLSYPLKNTMLGVNVFDFLKAIDAISSDARIEPGMVMPTLRAKGVRVASAPSARQKP